MRKTGRQGAFRRDWDRDRGYATGWERAVEQSGRFLFYRVRFFVFFPSVWSASVLGGRALVFDLLVYLSLLAVAVHRLFNDGE